MEEEDDRHMKKMVKLIEAASNGVLGNGLERLTLSGLQVLDSTRTSLRCKFIVPISLADENGNWHVGAMATLIDDIGAATVFSFTAGHVKASLDFSVSYLSTARVQEEVEIEANIIGGYMGRLTYVLVEVRRSVNGELIALGKQWMASSQKPSKL